MPFTRGLGSSKALMATQRLVSGAGAGGLLHPGSGCLPVKPVMPRVLQRNTRQTVMPAKLLLLGVFSVKASGSEIFLCVGQPLHCHMVEGSLCDNLSPSHRNTMP
jgi:hypothetical protein